MGTRRPTIIDVAGRAGVSKSTVSLVLQQSPLVREETRREVLRAMADLGYVYNRSAANLRSANVGLIGLVINDLMNPFFTEFATSVQMTLSARGYATVIANTDETPALQQQVIAAMLEHAVSALIISPTFGAERATFSAIARAGVPALQVLRRATGDAAFPFAAPDYPTGGRLATEHLVACGARRIAFVGGLAGRGVTRLRMSGYLDVLAEHGIEPLILDGRPERAFGSAIARRLAHEFPDVDAALCFNDLAALGVLAGSARIGRRVGRDFRVVGFDDIKECASSWPALSSVRCGIAQFGRDVAVTVLRWLEDDCRPPEKRLTPVSLVVRESSAP